MIKMLFSTTHKDMELERMTTSVPGFGRRGHGVYVFNKFKYTAKDCDCRLCSHYDRKKKCELPKCVCIEERIEAGAIGYAEFMSHTFEAISNAAFQRRLNECIKESEDCPMIYRGKAHEEMFKAAIERSLSSDSAMLSALYLLTADKHLWSIAKRSIGNKSIDFSAIHLGGVSTDASTLFMTARDLYEGTRHITVSDIADHEIVPHKLFGILCHAMAIRRYGMNAVGVFEKDGDGR